jgi:hypothetical protein
MNRNEFTGNDEQLKSILQKAGMEEPSADFTDRLMAKIQAAPIRPFVYQPVISRKGWLLSIIAFTTICFLITLSPAEPGSAIPGFTPYMQGFLFLMSQSVSGLLGKISSLSSFTTVALVIACGWFLYAADKIIRKMMLTKS